jgi:hypothetical protein
MNETKNLSYAALEEALLNIQGELLQANRRLCLTPTKLLLLVHLCNLKPALKILRGAGWHHKHTARWRYLVRRGARK